MAILTADNFKYQGRKPLDSRIVQKTKTDMTSMAESIIYSGIICYVEDEQKFYVFDTNNTVDPILKKWRELTTGGSGNAKINRYKQNTDYKTDEIIIYDDKIYLVLADFKSDNTQAALADSFDLDLKNNKFVPLDKDTNCVEYKQNTNYIKDMLVYVDNKLARVVADFISDNTATNINDAFDIDIASNKLVLVSEDKVVDRIKSNTTLTTTIGSTTTIAITDLPSTTINDVKLNQLVYDKDGTVGFISNIDITNNDVTVLTITKSDGNEKTIRYKSDVLLDKTILNQSTINFTDLNTLYTVADLLENKLVYDKDGTVGKIDTITTTPAGTTIVITTLTTSIKGFELDYYKYDNLLNKDVDTTQNILFTDLSISTTLTINDLKENQIVFDEEGTISKIENIDTVNNELTVRIITIDTISASMKEYKITETLDLAVDSQLLVNVPSGVNINDIMIDQLVYDDNGTVAKIISIDTTQNKLLVQTITGLGMPIAPDTKKLKIENGGSGYQVGDIIESTTAGLFAKVTMVDTNGAILEITDITATAQSVNGTDAKIGNEQVIYGGYGRNWAALSNAAVQVATVVAEKFVYEEGYTFEIVNAGSNYAVGDIIGTDKSDVFVSITSVGVSGEILNVQYTRDDTVTTSGTGANISAIPSKDVFIILDKYWNEGIALFTLVNDDGAWVEFLRTDDSLVKYSAGPNNKTYKFVYNPANGTITQSYTMCNGGGSTEGISFEETKNYLENDLIMRNNKLYKCTQDYTSTNDFDTDLNNGYWEQYQIVEIGGEII